MVRRRMNVPEPARRDGRLSAAMLGALLVGLVETAWVLTMSPVVGWRERVALLGVELGASAIVAGVLAALASLFVKAARERWPALAALVAVPLLGLFAWLAFLGPRAHVMPGRFVMQVGIVAFGALVVHAVMRFVIHGQRHVVGVVLLGVMLAACVADQVVLPRLYPFLHRALELVALVAAALGVRAWIHGAPAAGVNVAVSVAGVAIVLAAVGLEPSVTTVVLERAPAASTVLRPLLRLRSWWYPAPVLSTDGVAHRALPPGPVLGSRDVVLVTVDALRADRLTAAVMPAMRALADRGVRFEDARTPVPHTSFAVASLLTGRHTYALAPSDLAALTTHSLPELFRERGYRSAAFYPPAVFFIDRERLAPFEQSHYGFQYVKYEYLDATRRTDQVIAYFEEERPARAFVWVHYFEPHEPYDVHPGITADGPQDAITRYEGEARLVDVELARLVEYLRLHRPGALLVLCADHGEEFGEHGGRYHGTTLFDEQLRVPLFFAVLGEAPSFPPRVVPGAVSLVDVAPTIASLVALEQRESLASFMSAASDSPGDPVFAEIDQRKAVVEGEWKLICDLAVGSCALYGLRSDRAEQHDVGEQHTDVVQRLRAKLDRFQALATAPPRGPSEEARAALAANTAVALVAALAHAEDEHDVVPLATALGKTQDPLALDALLLALKPVRSRAAVVAAVDALHDARAIPWLLRALPSEPYVPVRVAMVEALVHLAAAHDDAQRMEVRAALLALAATEQEAPALRSIVAALPLERSGGVRIGRIVTPVEPGIERLLVLHDPHATSIRLLDGTELPAVEGIVRIPATTSSKLVELSARDLVLQRPAAR